MYVEAFSGSGSLVKSFSKPMRSFTIINDNDYDLTFTIQSQTFTVHTAEEFTGEFPGFYGVNISALGSWRAYVSGSETPTAIPAKVLFTELRYELRDMDKNKYSDYELIAVLNTVLSLINSFVAHEPNMRLFSTKADITLNSGQADLPPDFLKIISIKSGDTFLEISDYQILGTTIYCDNYNTLTLRYNYAFGKISGIDEVLPIPAFMNDFVKKYMRLLLTGEQRDVFPMIVADMHKLIVGRESVGYDMPVPFTV